MKTRTDVALTSFSHIAGDEEPEKLRNRQTSRHDGRDDSCFDGRTSHCYSKQVLSLFIDHRYAIANPKWWNQRMNPKDDHQDALVFFLHEDRWHESVQRSDKDPRRARMSEKDLSSCSSTTSQSNSQHGFDVNYLCATEFLSAEFQWPRSTPRCQRWVHPNDCH